jgi:hypothetical protein
MDVHGLAAYLGLPTDPFCEHWLGWPPIEEAHRRRLATLCRLPAAVLSEGHLVRPPVLMYCHRCLVLNDEEVSAPFWRDCWLAGMADPKCTARGHACEFTRGSVISRSRNMRSLVSAVCRERDRRIRDRDGLFGC